MVTSENVANCMGTQLIRYAAGRSERNGDACEVEALGGVLLEGDSMQEMFIAMALSDTFRRRQGGE